MTYTPILGTLGYVMSPDNKQTLLLHRNKRRDDHYFGKYIGLGGKLEPNENVISGLKREIFEESGLVCQKLVLCGTINWLDVNKKKESWFGFIFRVDSYTGTPHLDNHEGTLTWVPKKNVFDLPMNNGDSYFLPMVFGASQQFHGVMLRENGKVISWDYSFAK
jgi:8-oxo-dGTP diphosphatase